MYKLGLLVTLPIEAKLKYEEYLLTLVRKISFLIKKLLVIDSVFGENYKKLTRTDNDFNSNLENIIKLIEAKIVSELNLFLKKITRIAVIAEKFNYKAVEKSLNGVKKSIPTLRNAKVQSEMKMWVSENVRLIKTIPEKMLTKVEEIVYTAVRTGVTHTELSKRLVESFGVSKKRAVIIARDQINKLSGNLTRVRNLELDIDEYKWLTSRDDRCRPSHKVLEGKICSWEDVNVYKSVDKSVDKDVDNSKKWLQRKSIGGTISHPSQDVLCRCTSIPIIKI
jgi:SPP1 gp7 family putative phage head morphogenesis protein